MNHTNYKIGVLTNAYGPSMQDLDAHAKKYDVTFDQITFDVMSVTNFENSELITTCREYDVIYYRTGLRDSLIHRLTDILESEGIPVINSGHKHPRSHRKSQQAIIADEYNINQPKCCLANKPNFEKLSALLGVPFVAKPDNGSKGKDVVLIRTEKDLVSLIEKKDNFNPTLFQEFIQGADEYRVYTIGNTGVATYKKVLGENDFRANLHVGGSMTETEPEREPALLEFGGHVAHCFGADFSGIDILYKDGACIFIELNWQPGWENLQKLSGENYAKASLQHLLDQAHEAKRH